MTKSEVDVYLAPYGELLETWPENTLFTSSQQDEEWIEVTGHFPDGTWQPLERHVFISMVANIEERTIIANDAPAMVIHQQLIARHTSAKAYRLLQQAPWFQSQEAALAFSLKQIRSLEQKNTNHVVEKNEMPGATTEVATMQEHTAQRFFEAGTTITTNQEDKHTIKVTGLFPDGTWQPAQDDMWIAKPLRVQNRTQPKMYLRDKQVMRFAVIDKASFDVTVYEVKGQQQTKLVTAPVALGYDKCLPASKGGKCYYTPEGQYEIEFKLFDPDGINWCVPKKMEGEFQQQLAKGERCWRGIMGKHAMHFGDSLFLHGTSNPNSIGSRTTHGCVRLRNSDIEVLFRLLQNGDQVLISDNPETLDLVAIAAAKMSELNKTEHTEQAIDTNDVGKLGEVENKLN